MVLHARMMLSLLFYWGMVCSDSQALDVSRQLSLSSAESRIVKDVPAQWGKLTSSKPSLTMEYTLFDGTSILRSPVTAQIMKKTPKNWNKTLRAIFALLYCNNDRDNNNNDDDKDNTPSLLLLPSSLDVCHEILNGVTAETVSEAEYAATHRYQTDWGARHPFSDEDDLVHSLVHRLEGNAVGEGDYTGWQSAKYWVAGGPKQHHTLGNHPVHQALTQLCPASCQAQLVTNDNNERRHEIIAGGGKTRFVSIEAHSWDPIAFINLCRDYPSHLRQEIDQLCLWELQLLIRYELLRLQNLLPSCPLLAL